MTFDAWALTDAEKLVRVNLKAWDGSEEISLFVATRYYLDSVNDVEYLDRLIDPLIIRRSLGGAFGRPEATVGAISIDNSDRELDDWIDYGWHGREVEILLGDPSWASDDSRWSTRFKGLADKMEGEDNVLTLFLRDKSEKLDRPIVQRPLNMHPQAFLRPFPVTIGEPQNISPVMTQTVTSLGGSGQNGYLINAWDVDNPTVPTTYENGLATVKAVTATNHIGGGVAGVTFSISDPEGTVTTDGFPASDDPVSGSGLNKAGETLKYLFSYEMNRESGIATGGSTTDVVLDENAVHEDDYYTAPATVSDHTDPGYIAVFRRDADEADIGEISNQTGNTVSVASAFSFSVSHGDRYDIVPPERTRYGPLTESEVDSTALDLLDLYNLGIWDGGGEMTYLDLLDNIFPGGFFYYWKSDGTITAGLLKDPSEDSPVFTIDQYETRGKIRLIQDDAPIYRARVGWDRNWTVITSPDPDVDTDRAAFLNREYQWELDEDLTVRDAYPESTSQDFPSFILERADAQTEAQRLMDLFGVARKRIMVEGLSGLFSVDLHDVVTLKDDTYGLDNGKDYRVVMMEERPIEGTVDVELWG